MITRTRLLLFLGIGLLVGGLALLSTTAFPAVAQDITPSPTPGLSYSEALRATIAAGPRSPEITAEPTEPAQRAATSDDYCLLCHRQSNQVWVLMSGETLNTTIDVSVLADSVHGESNPAGALGCADCHPNWRYPHPSYSVRNLREFREERYAICQNCHEAIYARVQTATHGVPNRNNQVEPMICAECHGGHDTQPSDEPRSQVTQTCGRCHTDIFDDYLHDAHILTPTGENDILTCTDCHGFHDIGAPNTDTLRNRSPGLCVECHVDSYLVGKSMPPRTPAPTLSP